MSGLGFLRPWAAVHATRPALALHAVVLLLSLFLATTYVTEIGFIRFAAPISMLTLLPVAAGTGAALCSVLTFDMPLPDPPKARAARALWALVGLVPAWAAANVGLLVNPMVSMGATSRNVLIAAALGLFMARLAEGRYVWLPVLALTLLAMLFGYPEHGEDYYWWAVMLEADTTTRQLALAAVLYGAAVVSIVVFGAGRTRPHAPRERRS